MNYLAKYLLYAIVLFAVCACTGTTAKEARVVTVTILPQQFLAEQIAGDRFEINCIVPAGSSPETYDPSPAHWMSLGESEAYFRIGEIGFEIAWMDKLEQNNPAMQIFDNSQGVDMIECTHAHSHGDRVHSFHVADPHIWCSPKNVYVIARNMYEAFLQLDPDGEAYYTANYEALVSRIAAVDSVVTTTLAPVEGKAFAIFHPSLSYLARDYGLQQLSLENEGKESSALYLKQVVEEARAHDVSVVFVQKEFNARQVETFASELGLRVVTINPLNYDWETETINIAHAIAAE